MAARARAAQPEWEAYGFDGRARVLLRAQKWMMDNAERVDRDDRLGDRQDLRGRRSSPRSATPATRSASGPRTAPEYLADERVKSSQLLVKGKKLILPLPAARPDRRDRPVELPADELLRRLHPGADGRQQRDPQALGGHAADLAADGRGPARVRPARGRLADRDRPRRDRRGADRARRHDHVHRLDADRAQGRRGGRAAADPGLAGARRQGPDDRALRRRPRARGQLRRPTTRCRTPARPASRSSASTSRSRSTTSSSRKSPRKCARCASGKPDGPGIGRGRRDHLPAAARDDQGPRRRRRRRRARACSPAATQAPGAGRFYEPTVLVDVDHTMKCMTEETFGPTLPIMKVADAEEAVRLANDSPYGLGASVFTRDTERGEADRAAPRGRRGQRQRRDDQLHRARAADGRRQGLRPRLAPRRRRDPQVLLPAGDRRDAETGA